MGDEGSDGIRPTSSPYRSKFPTTPTSAPTRLRNGNVTSDPNSWRSYTESEPTDSVIPKFDIDPEIPLERMVTLTGFSASESDDGKGGTGLLIGQELLGADPDAQEEMQRKKEKIMLQSLRRKQQVWTELLFLHFRPSRIGPRTQTRMEPFFNLSRAEIHQVLLLHSTLLV